MADLVLEADVTAAWPAFASQAGAERAALISAASAAVEDYCGRVFASATVTEAHPGQGPRLYLRRPPITSITSITVSGSAVDNTNLDQWSFDADSGVLTRGDYRGDPAWASSWPAGSGNVTVVYVGGYTLVPDPVKRACILSVIHLANSTTATGPYKREKAGEYEYELTEAAQGGAGAAGLPGIARALLAPYVLSHGLIA